MIINRLSVMTQHKNTQSDLAIFQTTCNQTIKSLIHDIGRFN